MNLLCMFLAVPCLGVSGDSAHLHLQMNQQEMSAATHVLGTLFRDYLAQIREEQLSGTLKTEEPQLRPESNAEEIEELLE